MWCALDGALLPRALVGAVSSALLGLASGLGMDIGHSPVVATTETTTWVVRDDCSSLVRLLGYPYSRLLPHTSGVYGWWLDWVWTV